MTICVHYGWHRASNNNEHTITSDATELIEWNDDGEANKTCFRCYEYHLDFMLFCGISARVNYFVSNFQKYSSNVKCGTFKKFSCSKWNTFQFIPTSTKRIATPNSSNFKFVRMFECRNWQVRFHTHNNDVLMVASWAA